jgi:hypothetical protein
MMMEEKNERQTGQIAGPSMPPSMAPLKPPVANNLAIDIEFPLNLFHHKLKRVVNRG